MNAVKIAASTGIRRRGLDEVLVDSMLEHGSPEYRDPSGAAAAAMSAHTDYARFELRRFC
jgi:hypothetical protein